MHFHRAPLHLQIWMASAAGQRSMTQAHPVHQKDLWCTPLARLRMTMRGSFTWHTPITAVSAGIFPLVTTELPRISFSIRMCIWSTQLKCKILRWIWIR
jgi:hypothetical protein